VLHVCGMTCLRFPGEGIDLTRPGPYISLLAAGTPHYFEIELPRENYVLMLDHLPVRRSGIPGRVELRFDQDWIHVPMIIPLNRLELEPLLRVMRKILPRAGSPLPAERLEAHLLVTSLLRRFVEPGAPAGTSPAMLLRQALDQDTTFRRSLAYLARASEYSMDHLRLVFRREFGITPQEYRNQRRLALIMDLITGTTLPLKQIAARAGFDYLSHFSAFFRSHTGQTPRQALKKYRYHTESLN